jgi:hypothetical protein
MKTYILFLFASFNDLEDLEFFCFEHFPQIAVGSIKYVIEANGSSVILFDSDKEKDDLTTSLDEILEIEYIRFYMVFEKSSIFWSKIPEDLNNFIFKPQSKNLDMFKVLTKKLNKPPHQTMDLDAILEKIKLNGIDALTPEEKKFLDDFGI